MGHGAAVGALGPGVHHRVRSASSSDGQRRVMSAARSRVMVDARMAMDGGIGTYLQALVPRISRLRRDWSITALGDRAALEVAGWGNLPNVRLLHCGARI